MRPNYYRAEVKARTDDCLPETDMVVQVECFDLIDALFAGDFYLGNAMKYLFRAGRKEGQSKDDDLAKAITYLRRARAPE